MQEIGVLWAQGGFVNTKAFDCCKIVASGVQGKRHEHKVLESLVMVFIAQLTTQSGPHPGVTGPG